MTTSNKKVADEYIESSAEGYKCVNRSCHIHVEFDVDEDIAFENDSTTTRPPLPLPLPPSQVKSLHPLQQTRPCVPYSTAVAASSHNQRLLCISAAR